MYRIHGANIGLKKKADVLIGTNGDDVLDGDDGRDVILGRKGNDFLDGGAGFDIVLAGRGDDVANYALSENQGTRDYYDGGRGFDTLQLTLTSAELQLPAVQADIAAFQAFLDGTGHGHARAFHFSSFDLTVRNFEALEIRLAGGNAAPVALDDLFPGNEDAPLSGNVLANDTDAEGSTLGAALVSGPEHGTLVLNADGSFTYTPEADFNGEDSFTYLVNDGELDSNIATVTLAVAPVNDAPVALDDLFPGNEDAPLSGNVLANDTDVEGSTLSAALVSGPAHGTLVLDADGSFSYTPAADFNGEDSFTYLVNDGELDSNIATVTLAVAPVNDAPVAADDAFAGQEDAPLNGNVLANDVDVDGDTLSAHLVQDASHGTLVFNSDGSFTYTPDLDYFGDDLFTYRASDGPSESNLATVNLTINAAPVAVDDAIEGSGGPVHVAVVGGSLSTYLDAAAQLNDSVEFDIDADAILVTAYTTEAQWAAALDAYDVVVIGGNGQTADYASSPIFGALRDFVDAGGGVVSTGWFASALAGLPSAIQADADYVTPISTAGYDYVLPNSTISVLDPSHPIANGISSFTTPEFHEMAISLDAGATALATGTKFSTLPAIAYDEVGLGLTVYLGGIYMAHPAYSPDGTRSGDLDTVFEQAVVWAAGPDAATDEDTPLVIDDAQLLANDTDADGDVLAIVSVNSSLLGAAVWIDASGNITYDPNSSQVLQDLAAGEVVTDYFDYEISDGNGGTDTGSVSITVEGLVDVAGSLGDDGAGLVSSAVDADVLL